MNPWLRDGLATVAICVLVVIMFCSIALAVSVINTYFGGCKDDYVHVVTEEWRGCVPWQEAVDRG